MRLNQNILAQRYQLLETIGNGGMATVYKAKDLALNRIVAVKVMNPELTHEKEFIQRFTWEAKATGSLSHENIVSIYDVGNDQRTYYMVMEYVDGITLKELIHQKGKIPPDEAIDIASQICDALAHAHQNQIIHRDIKPQNIMCSADGHYRITDFGIARLTRSSSNLTKTGIVMGSVHYFSPEQAQGKQVDFTTDLYSLGVVLYEMVTGRPPYDAPEHIAVALMHIQSEIPHPKEHNPDLPDALIDIIKKAMAKQPKDRFRSAMEMKQALQSIKTNTPPVMQTDEPFTTPPAAQKTKKRIPKIVWGITTFASILLITLFGYSYAEANFFKKESPTSKMQDLEEPITHTNPPSPVQPEKPVIKEEPPVHKKEKKPQQENKPHEKKSAKKGDFIIFIGSFEQKENAERLSKRLNEKGIQTNIQQSIVFGKTMHRVIGGEFESRQEAEQQLDKIKQSGIKGTSDAIIVNLNELKK